MNRIHRSALRGGLILALTVSVVACSPSKTRVPPDNGGGAVTTKQEDQFGIVFGTAFRVLNDSEPYSPNDGDIVPISLTAEPVDIK